VVDAGAVVLVVLVPLVLVLDDELFDGSDAVHLRRTTS
jgi:hypothetical protein